MPGDRMNNYTVMSGHYPSSYECLMHDYTAIPVILAFAKHCHPARTQVLDFEIDGGRYSFDFMRR